MRQYTLEVCCDAVESALCAARGGADRIELCGNLVIGGTTPDPALFAEIRKHTDIRTHVLLRPRFGDFCYTDYEFAILKENVKTFRALGAEGIVIGCLQPDGSLDRKRMEQLMAEADGMWVTLHRAFDVCADALETYRVCRALGVNCILTSGQKDSALAGADLLRQLEQLRLAEGGPELMAGSGVCSENIPLLCEQTGLHAYHMSAKRVEESAMRYRREGVHMGLKEMSEYAIYRTDEAEVRKAAAFLKRQSQC